MLHISQGITYPVRYFPYVPKGIFPLPKTGLHSYTRLQGVRTCIFTLSPGSVAP